MATTDFKTGLQALRDKMPSGYIQAICKDDNAKRVALQKVFNKNSADELTLRERDILDEFLEYAKEQIDIKGQLENKVNELVKQL